MSQHASYVSHFFATPDYWVQITKGARGAAQPGVNATTLKALTIPLPPLTEQRRIAEVLDRAEALRAKRRAAIAQLDTLTQSIFLDLFGDPVTERPTGWPHTNKLGELLTSVTGGSRGCGMRVLSLTQAIPFLRMQNRATRAAS